MKKKLSLKKMCELLKKIDCATICTIKTKTEVKLRSVDGEGNENNFSPSVTKISTVNGILCSDYENAVNKQRGKEGLKKNFSSKSRAWGTRIGDSSLIEHKGEFYLEIRVLSSSYLYETDEGVPLSDEEVELISKFLPPSRPTRQGVENEIVVRTYNLSNIREVCYSGSRYILS